MDETALTGRPFGLIRPELPLRLENLKNNSTFPPRITYRGFIMDSIEPHHRYGKRFSLISIAAAIALVLGASVKAQETTDIKLDLNTYTLYDAANRADVVRVTGDKA